MFNLNLFSISGLAIAITFIPLIILVAQELKNNKKLLPYLMHLILVLLWGAGAIAVGLCKNSAQADIAWKIAYSAVIFIPIPFYQVVLSLNNIERNLMFLFLYLQGIIFLLINLNDSLFLPSKPVWDSVYSVQATPIFSLQFLIWGAIVVAAHIELFISYKRSINKKQNLIFLIIEAVGFIGGFSNFFGIYNIPFPPIGNFMIALYSIIFTYAILRHQFLNIKIVIKKSIVYTSLLAIISIAYLISVVISERFLQNLVGYQSLAMTGLLTFGLGLLFIPLKNAIETLIDRYFFKGSPEELSEQIKKYSVQVQEGEKYKTTATLASGLAHEIKNPLTAIRTFCEYLPNKINDKQFLKEFSRIVKNEAQRINDLVDDLVEYGKPSPPKISPVRIHRLLDETLDLLSSTCLQKKITMEKLFNKDDALVLMTDKNQIRQAALNLLLNAVLVYD